MSIPQETVDQINKTIAESLPAQVGSVLAQRLKDADKFEKDLASAQADTKSARASLDTAMAQLHEVRAEIQKHKALAEREAAVAERELKAEVMELRTKLEASCGNAEFARNVALGLVRNTEFRSSVYSADNRQLINPSGYLTPVTESSSKTETKGAD